MKHVFTAAAVTAAGFALSAPVAQAETIKVDSASAFAAAITRVGDGDVIELADKQFPPLSMFKKSWNGHITIRGSGNTKLGGLLVEEVRGSLTLEKLAVQPLAGDPAVVHLRNVSGVDIRNVHFDGLSPGPGAGLDIARTASRVLVEDSSFSHCRYGQPCLQPGGAGVTIRRVAFIESQDTDAIRGGGTNVVIEDSVFDDLVRGARGVIHNDFIHIMGGGPWRISRSRFGQRRAGAAQIWVNNGVVGASSDGVNIGDVEIDSNVFTGTMLYAIRVGNLTKRPDARMRIVNNTILSGDAASIWLADAFENAPVDARPLVANNVLRVQGRRICRMGRLFSNVIANGYTCGPGDVVADPKLSPTGMPTAQSDVLKATADARFAPDWDLFGTWRWPNPDRGAVEIGATAAAEVADESWTRVEDDGLIDADVVADLDRQLED